MVIVEMPVADFLCRVNEPEPAAKPCEDRDGTDIDCVVDQAGCEGNQTLIWLHRHDLNLGHFHTSAGGEKVEAAKVLAILVCLDFSNAACSFLKKFFTTA